MLLSSLMIFFLILQFSLETYIVLFCIDSLHHSITTASYLLSITHLGGVVGRLSWGTISDFLFHGKRKIVLMIIGSVSSILCFSFAILSQQLPIWSIGVLALIFGACAIGWNGIYLTLVVELVGKGREGMGTGVSLTIAYLGILIGPPCFGYIVDKTGSYTHAWLLLCIMILLTIIFLGLVREPKKILLKEIK